MIHSAHPTGDIGADAAPHVVLLVPVGSIHPKSGSGQRTAILFDALRRLGRVSVVILSERPTQGAEVFFPGADRVLSITTPAMAAPAGNLLVRALQAIRRLLMPGWTYAPSPALRADLLGLFGSMDATAPATRILVARYTRTFALAGLTDDPAARLFACVDIDDRDDLKIDLQIRVRLGRVLGALARPLWRPRYVSAMRRALAQASLLCVAKPDDRLSLSGPRQIVVPNVPFVAPMAEALADAGDTAESLLFVGTAGHRPNFTGVLWFLRACWPQIRAARPNATFRIVGLGDWSALPADLTAQPGVQVVGTVDDIAAEYARARAALCPVREGAGSQIKVIEACAHARPVVTTAFAAGGFGPEIEAGLCVASDPQGFAEACIALLSDPARAARQGAALRALQQATHSRDAVERLIVSTLSDLIGQPHPRTEAAS